MTVEEMLANAEIQHLTADWTDAVNWRDYERFARMWTADATWTISEPIPMSVTGRDAIVTELRKLLGQNEAFYQACHTGLITLDGLDRATCRWGVTEFAKPLVAGTDYFNHAVYLDQVIRTPEGWKFTRRDYRYVYVDTAALNGSWYPLPEYP